MNSRTVLLGLFLLLTGCGSATPINYYVIDPVDSERLATFDNQSVQIIDLKIPQYLERFQIATRAGRNQLTFSDNHQWGENLRKNLLRTLARNLSRLLGTEDVGTPLSRSLAKANYALQVNIEQFDLQSNGQLILAARYQISGADGEVLATRGFESAAENVDEDDYREIVEVMQQLFGELSRDIADALAAMEKSA